MRVTNAQVWSAAEALPRMLELTLPIKTAYELAKLGRQLQEQRALLEQVRVKFVVQHGEKDERGQTAVQRGGKGWPEFVAAMNELMAQEVEIGGERVVVPMRDGMEVTPADLLALEPFVELAG